MRLLPLLPLPPLLRLLPLLVLLLLGVPGLAGAAPGARAEVVLKPPAQLRLDGIAPIPQALAKAIGGYAELRGHRFMDWHPTRREMLISHRSDGDATAQLHLVRNPGGALERITSGSEAISLARFEPVRGDYLLIARGAGGDEAFQFYRHDLADGRQTLLTDPAQRNAFGGWLRRSGRALLTAVPLDRTAEFGRRDSVSTTVWSVDPRVPEARRLIAELEGAGWWATEVSEDERFAVFTRYASVSRSEVWLLDLHTGASRRVLPRAGTDTPGAYLAAGLSTDARWLYFLTDAFGEFRQMARLHLGTDQVERIETELNWDVGDASLSRDGGLLALVYNVDGLRVLRMVSTATLREVPFAKLPMGSVLNVVFHPQGEELMVAMDRPQGPGEVLGVRANGEIENWTRAVVPRGLDASRFAEQQPIFWRSFDGLTISGLIARPSRRHAGRRPVLISIHGGPEAQSTAGFLGRWNYLIEELGVAMIFPNVRGSSGYGKRFLALDNGFLREDAVRDVGALLEWIRDQPDLDPERVAVMGGSYGGYMALATSIHFGERIRCAISIVGISHFVTFLERTESYRRDLRRAEYGDERDPAMRRFLNAISPLTQASRIQRPLFVIHGGNDPRVPVSEAEQIVDRLKTSGVPVWYLRADNEGHGFARKENADFQFYAMLMFLEQHLMGSRDPGAQR